MVHPHIVLCRHITVEMTEPTCSMTLEELGNLLHQTIDGASADQRTLME
jgi:hypothetical protein